MESISFQEILTQRSFVLTRQRELYMATVSNINMRYKELLQNDFGTTLVKNCARDVADEIVRRFFDTSDYYISPTQMFDRMLNFDYENDIDPLAATVPSEIRRAIYNTTDNEFATAAIQSINERNHKVQTKLFETEKNEKGNSVYKDRGVYIEPGKRKYRKEFIKEHGEIYDEVLEKATGNEQIDHVQAVGSATYHSKYMASQKSQDALKKFYNSKDNFQALNQSANGSKGDVRVFSNGKETISEVKYHRLEKDLLKKYKQRGVSEDEANEYVKNEMKEYSDITYKATAKEISDAIFDRWLNSQSKEKLMELGILTKDGEKVEPEVKEKILKNVKRSMNAESNIILKEADKMEIIKDAAAETQNSFKKIVMGQVIYYIFPPLLYETKNILKDRKQLSIDDFFKKLKQAGKRIVEYVRSKLSNIFSNIAVNSFQKFIKSLFDIIISVVKETVKKLVQIAKQVTMALIHSVRILMDKNASQPEKADAITQILAGTVTTIAIDTLFEYIKENFCGVGFLIEPLQFIVTILATNLVMLVLQKADLFDVQYGLLVANIDKAFAEEYQHYVERSDQLREEYMQYSNEKMLEIKTKLRYLVDSLNRLDLSQDDAFGNLNEINHIYNMEIDFSAEWKHYLGLSVSQQGK